jgi:methionine-rich copper-binding protein CopC
MRTGIVRRLAGSARALVRAPPCALLAVACAQTLVGPVFAHAFLDHATPAVGSTIRGTPDRVTLRFTQRLEPAFSRVQVYDARGKRIDKNDSKLSSDDASVLFVSLLPLTPGRYAVKWRVLSVDTHVTEGDFSFDVER